MKSNITLDHDDDGLVRETAARDTEFTKVFAVPLIAGSVVFVTTTSPPAGSSVLIDDPASFFGSSPAGVDELDSVDPESLVIEPPFVG